MFETFSTENWNRPKEEIDALMSMLVTTIAQEEKTLMENNIKLACIGDLKQISSETRNALLECIDRTNGNTGMVLILALNYSSRWEITEMVKEIAGKAKRGEINIEDINQEYISSQLTKPEGNDYLITKRRYSAFIGTDLDLLLQCLHVDTVFLIGGLTDVCVHFTAVDAHQSNYHFYVVTDCVTGSTWKAHEYALKNMKYLQRESNITTEDVLTAEVKSL